MKIYHYHPYTKEYLGEGFADKSPLDDDMLIPAHATEKTPIEMEEGKVLLFLEGEWQNIVIPENVSPDMNTELTPEELVNLNKQSVLLELESLDKKMTRASEDMFEVLLIKGLLVETDVPYLTPIKEQKEALRQKLRDLDNGGA